MSFRSVILSNFDEYLSCGMETSEDYAREESLRKERLLRFPYAVMLQAAFPELDFTNRWCWTSFGPAEGECTQRHSEYRACQMDGPHSHSGVWLDYWYGKTDYDFGFNEWYFANKSDYELFLGYVPNINWGENYPK